MKFIDRIKQRIELRRHPIPVEKLEECVCENCGYHFKGRFCPDCGQEVEEFNRPFGFFLYDISEISSHSTRGFSKHSKI